jgi:hypothetical protein
LEAIYSEIYMLVRPDGAVLNKQSGIAARDLLLSAVEEA